MSRRDLFDVALFLLAVTFGGFLYGLGTGHLPAPKEAQVFWAANFSAPYVIIPFAVGALARRRGLAIFAGALSTSAAIAGFYNILAADSLGFWARNLILGYPGGRPWVTVALLGGAVFGWLGYRWRRSRSRLLGLLVPIALIVEPLLYVIGFSDPRASRYAHSAHNMTLWLAEVALGIGMMFLLLRSDKAGTRLT